MIMVKEMNNFMKTDPTTYYDYEGDEYASSEELKAAFDHLYTTPEEIIKSISMHADGCELEH